MAMYILPECIAGQALKDVHKREGHVFVLLNFSAVPVFLGIFFGNLFCMIPAMDSGKRYMLLYFSLWSVILSMYYLTRPVNFLCERKPEYLKETHDFLQSIYLLLFSSDDWVRVTLGRRVA